MSKLPNAVRLYIAREQEQQQRTKREPLSPSASVPLVSVIKMYPHESVLIMGRIIYGSKKCQLGRGSHDCFSVVKKLKRRNTTRPAKHVYLFHEESN